MKLAIIGSRSFNNYVYLFDVLNPYKDKITLIVSDGAIGADRLGERFAVENNIETLIFIPDWDKFGKSAGYIRNKDIIDNCDKVLAFWDGKSKGTKHSIDYATKLNKPVKILWS